MWPFASGYPEVAFHELNEHYDYIIVGEFLFVAWSDQLS